MSRHYDFHQVDVFTDRIFGGNPLAVFPEAGGLSDEEMQAIALEMNLSETTFVLPPEDESSAAKVRIFTPRAELPFAGHPTIGTAWVLKELQRIPRDSLEATLELGIGPIKVSFGDGGEIWMHQGPPSFGEKIADRESIASALEATPGELAGDLPVQFVSTGLPFLYVPMASKDAVDRAVLSGSGLGPSAGGANGAFIFHSEPGSNRVYSRMIATIGGGVWEDPATGSASGPLGAYLVEHGVAAGDSPIEILSEQGTQMGRQSFVQIRVAVESGTQVAIDVGGQVIPALSGQLRLPT